MLCAVFHHHHGEVILAKSLCSFKSHILILVLVNGGSLQYSAFFMEFSLDISTMSESCFSSPHASKWQCSSSFFLGFLLAGQFWHQPLPVSTLMTPKYLSLVVDFLLNSRSFSETAYYTHLCLDFPNSLLVKSLDLGLQLNCSLVWLESHLPSLSIICKVGIIYPPHRVMKAERVFVKHAARCLGSLMFTCRNH